MEILKALHCSRRIKHLHLDAGMCLGSITRHFPGIMVRTGNMWGGGGVRVVVVGWGGCLGG